MKMFRSRAAAPAAGRLICVLAATAGLAAAASAEVTFRSGSVIDGPAQTAEAKTDAVRAIADSGSTRALLRFDAPVTKAQRQRLAENGVTLLDYAGGYAYFATIDADRAAARAGALLSVTAVHPIDSSWKLHPQLTGGTSPAHTIIGVEPGSRDKTRDAADLLVAVSVLFHRDVNAAGGGAEAVRAAGGRIVSTLRSVNAVVAHLPESRVAELAKDDRVLYVEPPIPTMGEFNAENRVITQVDTLQAAPYSLDGTGVSAFIYDGGSMLSTHSDHSSRLTVIDSDGVSDHATHVGGTVGGDGTGNFTHRGMATNVTLLSAGFEFDGSGTFLYTNPGDIEDDYSNAILNHGADISNNSIGSNIEPNGFNCAWQGDYGLTASVIDGVVRGNLTGSPMRIVWAAGNERTGTRCNVEGFGDYMSVPPPCGAKNSVKVGALNANDDSMTSFSTWGPTDDGRLVPDISAPGCQSNEDNGVTSTNSSGSYNTKCGTSMAAPTVTGIGSLIIQDYRAQFPELPIFRNSYLKALLAHTAVDLGNPGPDYSFGYGSVRAQEAIDHQRTGNFTEDVVGQGETFGAVAVVATGDPELKITMAWDDVPGTPLAASALVNDLDLVVTSPSGIRHYPWTLDPSNPSANASRTTEDRLNNIEQVLVDSPEAGAWTIEVVGFNVPEGPQPFSLVVTPFLVNCSDAGTLRMNSDLYSCLDIIDVRVVDCGLNTSDAVIDSVMVNVASDSDPAGFDILLTETAAESAAFTATMMIADDGSGDLLVSGGDTITATYIDADTGMGSGDTVQVSATVDCAPPVVYDVLATDIGPRAATVTFSTDEAAMPVVRWGTSCGDWTGEASASAFATSHALELTGLVDNTQYFFEVTASDGAGNSTTDDNSGACYSFMTPEIPDFFTQEFDDESDLDGMRLEFTPNGTFEFYDVCAEPVLDYAVSPAGGTPISLGDDTSVEIDFLDGATVSFYGVAYGSMHVGPNGYVTFGSGDSDYTETIAEHFDTPRISLAYDDLHPGQGGQVSWEQMGDRIVVTYDQVSERNSDSEISGQIEIFFDGRVAMTWLESSGIDCIAGLSAGTGIDPDFFESDLSAYNSCGPRPPAAGIATHELASNSSVEFNLLGSDDGLPGGPLVYTVTQLPANGFLADVNGGLIETAPYTLAPGEVALRYAPTAGFQGTDEVLFTVDDGGVAPDGGVSENTGVISFAVGVPTPVYEFLTDDSDPGWTTEGQWAFGMPTGGSGANGGPDPVGGFTGDNVYGYNLSGGYTNGMPFYTLTSDPIDCSALSGVEIEYQRWLGIESSTYDDASFQVSTNGTDWIDVWVHDGPSVNETQWSTRRYDLSAIADGQQLTLRWTIGTTDGSVNYCGWNIDDVRILALQPAAIECPHDLTSDGLTNADDLASVLAGWGTPAAGYLGGDLNGDGQVNADDLAVLLAAWNPIGCP